jgi:hypothetical protein
MTKQEAKELAIEKSCYYLEHPEAKGAEDLPRELFNRVKDLKNYCPMCELFFIKGCPWCPLKAEHEWPCNDFSQKTLQRNIAILQAWEVDG